MPIELELKPELKTKNRATSLTKTNDLQLDYWNKYVEICDELGLGNYQISAKAQHYADLKINLYLEDILFLEYFHNV